MDENTFVSNQEMGEELNQLARLIFDAAADNWYAAIGLEIAAGVLAVILATLNLSGDTALIGAMVGTILVVASYSLRLKFDIQYDTAETMRRQSVLSEALDWPISRVQMSEWRRQAGKQIRTQARLAPRDPDFYSTQKEIGAERLAEMTIESAFFTRHLYGKLCRWIWAVFITTLLAIVLLMALALIEAVPDSIDHLIASIVFAIIPVLLAIDLLGWGLRLKRLLSTIQSVEASLERLRGTPDMGVPQVLRLVAEYNCQVVTGIPIHNWLYAKWCNEIRKLWEQR
jgi:uncharacterized MnhB-related membrane protein